MCQDDTISNFNLCKSREFLLKKQMLCVVSYISKKVTAFLILVDYANVNHLIKLLFTLLSEKSYHIFFSLPSSLVKIALTHKWQNFNEDNVNW